MDGKFLGKIEKATYGYQNEGYFGLRLEFKFDNCSHVSSCIKYCVKDSSNLSWDSLHLKVLKSILEDAKVKTVDKLVGVPVEIEIHKNAFKDFRILKEVL